MDRCDVLIVGAGPAGSTAAWKLSREGLDVVILEKAKLPREKLCAGWITPAVVADLDLDLADYRSLRTLQPITGFRAGRIGGRALEIPYGRTVGYGIRRSEFDHYLAVRSGARVLDGVPLADLRRSGNAWVANGRFRAPLVIGAGGHLCPVARFLGADPGREEAVISQEVEVLLDTNQQPQCRARCGVPELYFCRDLKGYGWCFRKGPYLNVGLGRMDAGDFVRHARGFACFLISPGRVPADLPRKWVGHTYLLYRFSRRTRVDDGVILVGDAAGLAREVSGEGIGPAVESGLLAAQTILESRGDYRRGRLVRYLQLLEERFDSPREGWFRGTARRLPGPLLTALGGFLLSGRPLLRRIVLDRWFLRRFERGGAGAAGRANSPGPCR